MSYGVWLTVDTGGPEPATVGDDSWGYTSNCARMWRHAGADLASFHGRLAGDCTATLATAIAVLRGNPDRYREMNPENGWGDYDSLLPELVDLLALFRAHPLATVVVSR